MKVTIFGATGMIGQGVLRECLLAPEVAQVLTIGRTATGQRHDKLHEIVHPDFLDLSAVEDDLSGHDACFFCLGVSSAGMSEADYRRVTYEYTLSAARTMARTSPGMTFVYVSGKGTDSTESGRSMWARVKGETENALLAMPLPAYMFRPGFIQPRHGAWPRTRVYRVFYLLAAPVLPLARRLFPSQVTTTERLGRAMLDVAQHGAPKRVLEAADINALA